MSHRLTTLLCLVVLLPALVAAPATARCVEDLAKGCCCSSGKGCCDKPADAGARRGCCELKGNPPAPTTSAAASIDSEHPVEASPFAAVEDALQPRVGRAADPRRPAEPPPPELFTLHAAFLI